MIDVRNQMTDGYFGRYALDPAEVIGIAIHHSVSGGVFYDTLPDTETDEVAHLLAIDRYHVRQGYGGFGYHLAAFPSGRLYCCGSITGARAHVARRNNQLIGVVLIGDFTHVPPPAGSIDAARQAVAFIRHTYPNRPIGGHRDWALLGYPTSCPGATWPSWIRAFEQPPLSEDDPMNEADFTRIRTIVREELAATHGATAQPPVPTPTPGPITHIVAEGESLWTIAARYYGDGTRWPEIAAANNLDNPSLIHWGDVLQIP